MPAGAVGRQAIGHRSAQIASRRRRLRLIWRKLMSHDVTINEKEAVSKYLHSVPLKYI